MTIQLWSEIGPMARYVDDLQLLLPDLRAAGPDHGPGRRAAQPWIRETRREPARRDLRRGRHLPGRPGDPSNTTNEVEEEEEEDDDNNNNNDNRPPPPGGQLLYSMHMDGRRPGSAPNTLLDYFPEDFILVVDESHVAVPQIGGMYEGDMSRKRNLVDHGFRLPSAMDNRPLRWEEFLDRIGQTIYLSATPATTSSTRWVASTARCSRSSARPAWSTPRWWSSRPRARSTT